jgi:hypothetical protein
MRSRSGIQMPTQSLCFHRLRGMTRTVMLCPEKFETLRDAGFHVSSLLAQEH